MAGSGPGTTYPEHSEILSQFFPSRECWLVGWLLPIPFAMRFLLIPHLDTFFFASSTSTLVSFTQIASAVRVFKRFYLLATRRRSSPTHSLSLRLPPLLFSLSSSRGEFSQPAIFPLLLPGPPLLLSSSNRTSSVPSGPLSFLGQLAAFQIQQLPEKTFPPAHTLFLNNYFPSFATINFF